MLHARSIGAIAATLLGCSVANAQFSELVTDFETNGAGDDYATNVAAQDDLRVVLFQDPQESDATEANILSDSLGTNGLSGLRSTEETFVADFTVDGFFGANGSTQFSDIRFQWANTNADRWALIETLQSPMLGDPSVHLAGEVKLFINIPDCLSIEFPAGQYPNHQFTLANQIGVALLISETGRDVPQGRQDNDVLNGDFEFVGVTSVAFANTANPVPRPSTFIPITDSNCSGSSTGPTSDWREIVFDLDTANVVGWTFRGGDGTLNANSNGDMVNRGVLAGLVLTVPAGDTTSDFVEVLVDQVTFVSPVIDSASPPSIAVPAIAGDSVVKVNEVLSRATSAVLEIDRSDMDNEDPFAVDDTVTLNSPADFDLDPAGEVRFVEFNLPGESLADLAVGDRLRARQAINADISTNSQVILVNPPAEYSATLSLDENGVSNQFADFEWVGATAVVPQSGTQGKPIFPQNGVWQKIQYSLIPGVEPVISFAGGNGLLEPDGGEYKVDSMFFTIDPSSLKQGPFDLFIDHLFVIDENDNEILIADAESVNPFPNFRGQSTSTNGMGGAGDSSLSDLASYDGVKSNLIEWSWTDQASNNTCAPFRPDATFADTAKAVGMWLLVEDAKTVGLPLPAVEQQIIGEASLVTITNICSNATTVGLLVNAVESGQNTNPMGASTIGLAPTVTLTVGDSISAVADCGTAGLTDVAYARVVQRPAAPLVQEPLFANQTAVTVSGLLNSGNAIVSSVSLFDGVSLVDTITTTGVSSVKFALNPPLVAGQQINATQTVNNVVSVPSKSVGVGAGDIYCVVINEFQYDDGGVDDREFVELYNGGIDPVDITNWALRASDGTAPPADDNPDYMINTNAVLAPGDFFVVGDPSVLNVDLPIGGGDLWENENEAIELLDTNGVVVDTVIYELNKGPVAVGPAEGGIWGNSFSGDGTPSSVARWVDGVDTDNNGRDFGYLPATPGSTNGPASVAPYAQNFDGASAPTNVSGWIGSFESLRHANPTLVDGSDVNPNVISASPQGGNVGICRDVTGGNQCVLSDEPRYNVAFSVQVYIDTQGLWVASNGTPLEDESWSIGIGTVDSFHNRFALDSGSANGNTGLNWEFVVREAENTGSIGLVSLRLVNENDGADDETVRLNVPANQITTGWHTLSITRNYENFSGCYDAICTNGVAAGNGPGVLSMGYREFVANPGTALRPLTIDNLSVTVPTAPTLGGCCSACGCRLLTEAECTAQGDSYGGDGTDCSDGNMNDIADSCDALNAPAPVITAPLCTGDVFVEVTGLVPAATLVTVYEGGVNPIATAVPGGAASVPVYISPPLGNGDSITATQTVAGFEGMQSAAEVVGACPESFCIQSFSDDFDTSSSGAAWTVNTSGVDTAYQFGYDYSADGIPPSPNGSGTTMGLKVEANIVGPIGPEYLVATPNVASPTGNYRVEFDYWMNYPIGGGGTTGTEFMGGGVGYDGVTANIDGNLLYFTSDGGFARDYAMFKEHVEQRVGITNQTNQYTITSQDSANAAISAAFPAQSPPVAQGQVGMSPAGAQSFEWRTLTITVDAVFETINFKLDGFNIGTLVCGGEYGPTCDVGGALQLFYADRFPDNSTNASLQFGIFDNFRVLLEQPAGAMMGDWDGDGDVDVNDWPGMAACLEGPGVTPTFTGCSDECLSVFDYDMDLDVDLEDVANFTDDF